MVRQNLGTVVMGSPGLKSRSYKEAVHRGVAKVHQHAIDATELQQDQNGAILSNISNISKIDTVIIGNGPSALALSYLLHGNEPWYTSSEPHPDAVLHKKLLKKTGVDPISENPEDLRLYDVLRTPKDYDDITAHFFAASSMSYSAQALPLNTLLDTLLRPLADVDLEDCKSRVNWRKSSSGSVPHVILGEEPESGGQWAGDEVWFGDEDDEEEGDNGLKTLSYADFLSLPGYSLSDHYKQKYHKEMHPYYRPSRRLVAEYYATYPLNVGIKDALYPGTIVTNVERIEDMNGFNFLVSIKSKPNISPAPAHVIRCRNVVLATGIFSHRLPPPQIYAPFFDPTLKPARLKSFSPNVEVVDEKTASLPILVVGSGYTAADAILCNLGKRPIIHVYRWQPEERPSPLRGCHPEAYPGYAKVYRYMKEVALKKPATSDQYEGFPNGSIVDVKANGTIRISSKIRGGCEEVFERKVADIKVCIGRRGRLDYLAPTLCKEIGVKNLDYTNMEGADTTILVPLRKTTTRRNSKSHRPALHPTTSNTAGKVWVQHNSLRERVEENVEVTPNVFIIGSLTGDSLVRFAMGGCVYSAGRIIANASSIPESSDSSATASETSSVSEDEEDTKVISETRSRRPGRPKCVIV